MCAARRYPIKPPGDSLSGNTQGVLSVVAAVLIAWHVELMSISPYPTVMSVSCRVLLGLLFVVFNLAVTLRKHGSAIRNAHGLGAVVTDPRATISYAIIVAGALVILLPVATEFLSPATRSRQQPVLPRRPPSSL